jgi:hypothetical protein
MKTLLIILSAGCLMAACSTARQETSVDLKSQEGLVVSYFHASDEAAARELMAQRCAPEGFRVVSSEDRITGSFLIHGESKPLSRTFVKFECTAKGAGKA